ncbi:MAG: RNAse [Melioribacteraceae bacterium]|nr:MAG: RNAse [Melioribacteraceae bacterium]
MKEHYGVFKAANNYDILDPETGGILLECREENLSTASKILRFTGFKTVTPFYIEIREPGGKTLVTVQRGIAFFLSDVTIRDENGEVLGLLKQKLFSIGGSFDILDENGKPVMTLKGKWTGWEFKFEYEGKLLAKITKKWAGIGQELFTTADNYIIQITDLVPENSPLRGLIIGSVMCIDMVLKEKSN